MKVLCLGNNTEDTDTRAQHLALSQNIAFHGIISELDGTIPESFAEGYYHSSIYDIEYHRLVNLCSKFDQVLMLDQPKECYSHPTAFYRTVTLVKQLPNGVFQDPLQTADIDFFENLVKDNKSFCIFPFIELLTNQRTDGYTTVCCRSSTPIAHVDSIKDWQTDERYTTIREKMMRGDLLPEHCSTCYQLENKNIISARQKETVEWANWLNLRSIDDLKKITHPAYYEIRPSNICNLQCRMCGPQSSHLIGREYYHLKLTSHLPDREKSNFDIVDFTNLKKLYVAGGEPTAMPEFYDFLDRCIEQSTTDFEFLINTNATKINQRLKKQLKHFTKISFIISIEGLGELNHYIRWPSDWEDIIKNMHYLKDHGHALTVNVTVSMYNIMGLYRLLKFFDDEFPGMLVHAQLCSSVGDRLSAFNFPDRAAALANLEPIQHLNCYNNDSLLKSLIDSLIHHYRITRGPDLKKLRDFFEFNDLLDHSRSIKLCDYIPELEQFRSLIS